jgi:hypothetical protein
MRKNQVDRDSFKVIPLTNEEANNRMTLKQHLKKSLGDAVTRKVPKFEKGKFVFDSSAKITDVCEDIRQYGIDHYLSINKIPMDMIDDPQGASGNQVRDQLKYDSNIRSIIRSLARRIDRGMSFPDAQKTPVFLEETGNGRYQIVDGNHRFYALLVLDIDILPKAVLFPKDWFVKQGLTKDVFQVDCNPVAEQQGMKLKKVRETILSNWNTKWINASKERAIAWVKESNLTTATDESIVQMVNAIEKLLKKRAKQAEVAKAANAATSTKPNFFEWNGGKNEQDLKAPFHTHTFIKNNCAALIKDANYLSFDCSDGPMRDKIMGGFVRTLKNQSASIKHFVLNKIKKRKKNVLFLSVKAPNSGDMAGLNKNRINGLAGVLVFEESGFPFDEIYFLPQAAGVENLKTPILAWSKKNGTVKTFEKSKTKGSK